MKNTTKSYQAGYQNEENLIPNNSKLSFLNWPLFYLRKLMKMAFFYTVSGRGMYFKKKL